MRLDSTALPQDWPAGTYAARLMAEDGPVAIALLNGAAFDMTPAFGTVSRWLNEPDPAAAIRTRGVPVPLDLPAALANSAHASRDTAKPWLLAPVDLQAVKAAGSPMCDPCWNGSSRNAAMATPARPRRCGRRCARSSATTSRPSVPGSAEAMRIKAALVGKGWWSQYLEVGIGPDAEIFTKCQPLASVGPGAKVGVHPVSQWSNPEPEAVMAVNAPRHHPRRHAGQRREPAGCRGTARAAARPGQG